MAIAWMAHDAESLRDAGESGGNADWAPPSPGGALKGSMALRYDRTTTDQAMEWLEKMAEDVRVKLNTNC